MNPVKTKKLRANSMGLAKIIWVTYNPEWNRLLTGTNRELYRELLQIEFQTDNSTLGFIK
jgi:hypothetical protein